MHWAVQSKKDQMLEAPDFGNTNTITEEVWAQQPENSGDGLLGGSREQDDVAIPDVKPQATKNTDSPSKWKQQLEKIAVSGDWPEMGAFSHEKVFSRTVCWTFSFLNVVLGWDFGLGFMLLITYLMLKFSDAPSSLSQVSLFVC